MNGILNLLFDLLAGTVNVTAIRWPELSRPRLGESEFDQKAGRVRKAVGVAFLIALAVIPLALMEWFLSGS